MKAKKGDFIELFYTGYLMDGTVFDTNEASVAKEQGFDSSRIKPLRFKLGEGFVVKGFDEALVDKEVDKEYEVELEPEQAFGNRSRDLIRLIPLKKFFEYKLNPVVGLQVEINGQVGVVKSVTGGRVLVDFNHPLAGRKIKYKFKIAKIFDDVKDKVNVSLELLTGKAPTKVDLANDTVNVELDLELNDEIKKFLTNELKRLVPELEEKDIKFSSKPKTESMDNKN